MQPANTIRCVAAGPMAEIVTSRLPAMLLAMAPANFFGSVSLDTGNEFKFESGFIDMELLLKYGLVGGLQAQDN